MKPLNERLPNWQRDVFVLVAGLSLAYALNFSQRAIIPFLYPQMPIAIHLPGTLEWHLDLRALPEGAYYLSAGRPTGPCDLVLDGRILETTKSAQIGTLQSITLGASVKKGQYGPFNADIKCEPQNGFPSGLTDSPTILPYGIGRALQFYREFISIWLGVLAALYLLLSLLTLSSATINETKTEPIVSRQAGLNALFSNPFLTFALVAVIYGTSLSYAGWLFLSDSVAAFCHILIRLCLSYTFLRLGRSFAKKSRPYHFLFAALLIFYTGCFIFGDGKMTLLTAKYKQTHFLFGLTTLILWFDIKASRQMSKPSARFGSFALLWACAQWSDTISFFFHSPTYSAPVLLAIITWAVSSVRRAEVNLTDQVERVVNQILAVSTNSQLPVDHLLREVSATVAKETHFDRMSVYIDGYCLGRTAQPHRVLLRVSENGYSKTTDQDSEVSFEEGRGNFMLEAIRTGKTIFQQGTDGGWFCVIPVGGLACINLSDRRRTNSQEISESHAVIQRLQPAIRLLEDKLMAANLQRNVFLQRVKTIKGFGSWPMKFGTIRIDIEDSSKETTRFQLMNNGRDVYGEFINGKYVPALLKALSGYAELEEQFGDELYLIILPELSGMNLTVEESAAQAVTRFIDFAISDGAKLCIENGFEPLSWVGGATLGQGTLTCDEFKVRTSGTVANLSKRLSDCAKKGTLLVDEQIIKLLSPEQYAFGELREYLVKKDLVTARTINYRLTKKKAA